MFRAAKADSIDAKALRSLGILACVGIGADPDIAGLIGPFHQRCKGAAKRGFDHLGGPRQNLAG